MLHPWTLQRSKTVPASTCANRRSADERSNWTNFWPSSRDRPSRRESGPSGRVIVPNLPLMRPGQRFQPVSAQRQPVPHFSSFGSLSDAFFFTAIIHGAALFEFHLPLAHLLFHIPGPFGAILVVCYAFAVNGGWLRAAESDAMPNCKVCGKSMKNDLALKIHVGLMHKAGGPSIVVKKQAPSRATASDDLTSASTTDLIGELRRRAAVYDQVRALNL